MERNSLSSLPSELLCLVLENVDSARDFSSLVRSCSYIYSMFVQQKEILLSKHLRRVWDSEDLERDARVALRASEYPFTIQDSSSDYQVDMLYFLEEAQYANFHNQRIPLSMSSGLWKLQLVNELFLEDFSRRSISHIRQDFAGTANEYPEPPLSGPYFLSSTEFLRLQRAFYRYNTCQSIYRAHGYSNFREGPTAFALPLFLESFQPFEVEEITCVHEYILGRLSDTVEDIEDEFVSRVLDSEVILANNKFSREQGDPEPPLKKLIRALEPKDDLDSHHRGSSKSVFDKDGQYGFFSVDSKHRQGEYIKTLACHGTAFVNMFMSSSFTNKLSLINSICTSSLRPYFHKLLEDISQPVLASLWNIEIFDGDSSDSPNRGWHLVMSNRPLHRHGLPGSQNLRTWGYVFWDQQRLANTFLLPEPYCSRRRNSDSFWATLPCERTPSAEERLLRTGLTLSGGKLPASVRL